MCIRDRQLRIQTLGFLREPAAAVFNLIVPFMIIVFQALAFGDELVGDDLPGYRVADLLPLTASLMYAMTLGLFGVSIGLSSMVESRTLAGCRLRKGGVSTVVTSYIVVLFGLLFVGIAFAAVFSKVVWDVIDPARPLIVVVALLIAAAPLYALGAAIASVVGSPRSAQAVASAVFFPTLFLSGAIFPLDSLAPGLQNFARALPGYHSYEVLAYGYLPEENLPWASFAYLVVTVALFIAVAANRFSRREDL